MKLAQIKKNKVVAFYDDEIDDLPDNSHFVNVDALPQVELGDTYKNGKFSSETLA